MQNVERGETTISASAGTAAAAAAAGPPSKVASNGPSIVSLVAVTEAEEFAEDMDATKDGETKTSSSGASKKPAIAKESTTLPRQSSKRSRGCDTEKKKKKKKREQDRRREVNRGLEHLLTILVGADPVLKADQVGSADPKRTVETSDVALSRIDVIQRTVSVIRQLHQENQQLQTALKQQLLACSNSIPPVQLLQDAPSHGPADSLSQSQQRPLISMPVQNTARSSIERKSDIVAGLEASFRQAHREARQSIRHAGTESTGASARASRQNTVACSTTETSEMLRGRGRSEHADSDDYQADDDDSDCSATSTSKKRTTAPSSKLKSSRT